MDWMPAQAGMTNLSSHPKSVRIALIVFLAAWTRISFAQLPEDAAATLKEGHALFVRGDFKGASSAYRYVLTRSPLEKTSRPALALSLDFQGKHRDALDLWTALDAEAASADPWILYFLAQNRLMQGDFSYAEKTTLKLARLLGHPKKLPEQQILALNTLLLGVIQHLQKNYNDSSTNLEFTESLRGQPLAFARFLSGINCHEKENPACAIDRLRSAVKLDGTFQEGRRLLADIQAQFGDFDNAYLEARHYVNAEPDPEFQKKFRQFAKRTTMPTETLLKNRQTGFSTAWPKELSIQLKAPGPSLKVGLWSDAKGNPQTLTEATVIADSSYQAWLTDAGALTKNKKEEPLRLLFVSSPSAQTVLLSGNREFRMANTLVIRPELGSGSFLIKNARPSNEPVSIHTDLQVRGRLLVIPAANGFYMVNEVNLEDYLLGVLPAEIGGDSPQETLKTQAVLARSYTLWRQKEDRYHPRNAHPFDVCDQVHCQVYKGVLGETAAANQAVSQTAGESLESAGKPFQIWYHASCGGALADTGRKDQAAAQPPTLTSLEPADFLRFFLLEPFVPEGEEWCFERGSRFSWVRMVSLEELARKAKINYPEIGRLKSVLIENRAENGRIQKLRLIGSKGSRLIDEDYAIRLALAPGGLRSALHLMIPIQTGGRQRHLLFFGRGYGHGRGVCQVGAINQGKKQIPYKEILRFYYPEASIKKP